MLSAGPRTRALVRAYWQFHVQLWLRVVHARVYHTQHILLGQEARALTAGKQSACAACLPVGQRTGSQTVQAIQRQHNKRKGSAIVVGGRCVAWAVAHASTRIMHMDGRWWAAVACGAHGARPRPQWTTTATVKQHVKVLYQPLQYTYSPRARGVVFRGCGGWAVKQ